MPRISAVAIAVIWIVFATVPSPFSAYGIWIVSPPIPEIKIDEYKELTETIAAKRLTDKMQEVVLAAVDENDNFYITNRDNQLNKN